MKEICDIQIDTEAVSESIKKPHVDREGFERKHPLKPTANVGFSPEVMIALFELARAVTDGLRWNKKGRIILEYDPAALKSYFTCYMETDETERQVKEAGAVYEVTKAEIEKALNDAEVRHSGPAYGEKTTGSDVEVQNRLEKSYTCILPHGGSVKIDISATAESIGEDMFPALSEIGVASRDFYLEFGREINKTP